MLVIIIIIYRWGLKLETNDKFVTEICWTITLSLKHDSNATCVVRIAMARQFRFIVTNVILNYLLCMPNKLAIIWCQKTKKSNYKCIHICELFRLNREMNLWNDFVCEIFSLLFIQQNIVLIAQVSHKFQQTVARTHFAR